MEEINQSLQDTDTKKGHKTFKILSVDGGGIKGLYASSLLERFEEKFNCRTGECFDMLCGTSTGGLIALALSLNKTAKDVSDLYKENGKYIFPEQGFLGTIKQLIWRSKYSDDYLKKILYKEFGNSVIGDSDNLLCIPSYNYTDAKTCVFKFDHSEGDYSRDNKTKYVDIALATSAAPTFFPICEIDTYNQQFIDGGVWANNPSLVGVLEAICHFVGKEATKPYDSIQILSIGNFTELCSRPIVKNKNRSALKWGMQLLSPFFIGQSNFAHFALKLLEENSEINIEYVRIGDKPIGEQHKCQVNMDCASDESIKYISGQGRADADNWCRNEKIKSFFSSKKTYNTHNNGK